MCRLVPALLALLLAAGPGCATIGTFQRADSLGPGGYIVALEPSVYGISYQDLGVAPSLNVSARFGVGDRTDLGVRLGSAGIEVLSKVMLTDPEADGVMVSIAPSAGGFFVGTDEAGAGAYGFQVPVLIGIPMARDGQLVLGPKVHFIGGGAVASGATDSAGLVSLGTSVGYDAAFGASVHLLPEVALAVPMFAAGVGHVGLGSGVLFQAGVSVGFGKLHREHKAE